MRGLVGVWLAVIGYAVAYTGIDHFAGDPNAGLLNSLGYPPNAKQQAVQQAQSSFNLLNTLSSAIGFLFHLPNAPQLPPINTNAATTTTTGSSPGSLTV